MRTSKKGCPFLSVPWRIKAGLSWLADMLTNSLHISSANTDASIKSAARSFSYKFKRHWKFSKLQRMKRDNETTRMNERRALQYIKYEYSYSRLKCEKCGDLKSVSFFGYKTYFERQFSENSWNFGGHVHWGWRAQNEIFRGCIVRLLATGHQIVDKLQYKSKLAS